MLAKLMHGRMRQPVTYIVIGGLTALLYLAVALALTFSFAVAPGWASIGGLAFALPFSYLGHKLFTFRSSGEHRDELPRFVVAASLGLLISASVPELAVQQWNAPPAIGYLAVCVAVPAVNYMLLWLWVFARRRTPAPGPAVPDPADGR